MAHGGRFLVDTLERLGAERVFSVPGESFLAVLDALHDSPIQNVVCRQEGGAAMMAEATGKLTGLPGLCFVTRGPGATNASAGVHAARQDSTPMILFVGQIARGDRDREAFQEVDLAAMFAPLAKWSAEVREPERLGEYVARAWEVALSGRPGPVMLSLPEDVLSAKVEGVTVPGPVVRAGADWSGVAQEIAARVDRAQRPLVVAGGPGWSHRAAGDLAAFAEARGLPVATGFRRQDHFDNRHSHYAGDLNLGVNPKLAARLRDADALLVLGSRLGDIETQGYTLLPPGSHPGMIHVHSDPDEIGRVYRPGLGVVARAPEVLEALAALPGGADRGDFVAEARAEFEDWTRPRETPGEVKLEAVIRWLSDHLPEDTVVTNGAGNYAAWLHRYFRWKRFGTQLAPTSGSMGYGFPAAVAASIAYPGRAVVCLAGDGCFQMTLNEMSTAVQEGATPVVIVANNGQYGTIRLHQERNYPERVSGTALANPDFAALAQAYGGHGEVVSRTEDFAAAFGRAKEAGTVAVIELRLDPEALSPGATLSGVRGQ
ncbi:thiamine pyrophosphate-binding protein [Histidinibacterium lentulum]|uniref:Thiamine pyrophosphate-binding protein n=1 Tax=Histidinibacterium lentulum TaxID=2480588 RepID=A0A3N2R0R3_9RHOB|nr:thiamine pyrophosphate-binding protein [Histidinibacterium lentulum]ROU01070.1 thiamine pyrophosphate-binding protein [Histidinibacterium lentulum]